MALRLRRDVQKASYYVWFLGAEEAKGLRGARVINSVLPYLIDRSRGQEPLKVTLQVSHKGIKILQGSSKHFIPHSAITSSVQTDDIVACVLLLYNPATKCPLHVHAYRCDSESTAEALHQQLQVLINRPENQKRFEELETRLGILPPLPTAGNKSASHVGSNTSNGNGIGRSNDHNSQKHHYQSQPTQHQLHQQPHHSQPQSLHPSSQRRHEASPKRFSSSLGSDTGNSTRESECSEERSGGSPVSRSPPVAGKPLPLSVPLSQPTNELFDSLAAELRAKLNGNGPPLLLPPRDYDTVHRSKGNLTAIEMRRCRNALIVGGATPNETTVAPGDGKQVSSRGSSGIGSDLAPSPERQDLNSSSDDEQWSNEADNSVIALKPSQIAMERSPPIIPHHPQLNRKSAMQPPEDSYLRDLPAKPYTPRQGSGGGGGGGGGGGSALREKVAPAHERDSRSKTPSTTSRSREDEIKPIIMRPADYDVKFNRVLQAEQKQDYQRRTDGGGGRERERERERDRERGDHAKLRDSDKYNEINRLLNKKLSLERETPEQRYKHKTDDREDFDDSDPASDHHVPLHPPSSSYRKENLTDKQKFIEYTTKKQSKSFPGEEAAQRYGGRHRYVDPADLPFEQPPGPYKYAAVHRGTHSPQRSDLGHPHVNERERERDREPERVHERERERERDRKQYSRSNERNPYREPESIPYIQSMEKMMKSSAMRYKSFDGALETTASVLPPKEEMHTKVGPRSSKSYAAKRGDDLKIEYAPSSTSNGASKERFKDAKDKFRAMERTGSRYDLTDEKDVTDYRASRSRGSIEPVDNGRAYADWSDEEHLDEAPSHSASRSRSRSRGHLWEQQGGKPEREMLPSREQHPVRERQQRHYQEYAPDTRAMPGKRPEHRLATREHSTDINELRDNYGRDYRYEQRAPARDHSRDMPPQRDERERLHREPQRREYSPEVRPPVPEHRGSRRPNDKHTDYFATPTKALPLPLANNGAPIANVKNISNLSKGYRHSYAEPVFARAGGRVGLAAVNPY